MVATAVSVSVRTCRYAVDPTDTLGSQLEGCVLPPATRESNHRTSAKSRSEANGSSVCGRTNSRWVFGLDDLSHQTHTSTHDRREPRHERKHVTPAQRHPRNDRHVSPLLFRSFIFEPEGDRIVLHSDRVPEDAQWVNHQEHSVSTRDAEPRVCRLLVLHLWVVNANCVRLRLMLRPREAVCSAFCSVVAVLVLDCSR